jgi:hypothetical protein
VILRRRWISVPSASKIFLAAGEGVPEVKNPDLQAARGAVDPAIPSLCIQFHLARLFSLHVRFCSRIDGSDDPSPNLGGH